MVGVDDAHVAFAAREVEGESGQLFLLDKTTLDIIASAELFSDDDFIISALGASNSHLFVGDNSSFSSVPNRFASIEYSENGFGEMKSIEVLDPVSLVANGSGSVVLVSSGFGDALYQYVPSSNQLSEVSTQGASELPGVGAKISRGEWSGGVLVPENLAIRLVSFSGMDVIDQGKIVSGSGFTEIIGVVGISP